MDFEGLAKIVLLAPVLSPIQATTKASARHSKEISIIY